jgi:CheY-like chemotaxis protein
MERNTRVLLVEDNIDHRQDAVAALKDAGVDFEIACNLEEALERLDHVRTLGYCRLDGVLSDIFIPDCGAPGRVVVPGGVSVALRAEELGIPFIFCTSGYHHGDQFHWICMLGRQRRWPEMIDRIPPSITLRKAGHPPSNGNGSKNWRRAIEVLQTLIEEADSGAG